MRKLYKYQKEGVAFLKDKRFAILADDMGLGKSLQTLRALKKTGAQKTLIISPAVAAVAWSQELIAEKNLCSIEVTSKNFNPSKQKNVFESEINFKVFHCSYSFAPKVAEYFAKKKSPEPYFDVLILDEAHYLKTPSANRTQAIFGKKGLAKQAKKLWALSGTLAPNNASELYVWAKYLNLFKNEKGDPLSFTDFKQTFCLSRLIEIGNNIRVPTITGNNPITFPDLVKKLKPYMLRRLKTDELGLKPVEFQVFPCEFPTNIKTKNWIPVKNQLALERAALAEKLNCKDNWAEVELAITKQSAAGPVTEQTLDQLQLLSNSISGVMRYHEIKKALAASQLVKSEFEQGQHKKLVVFATHRIVIDFLEKEFKKIGVVTVSGKTPLNERKKAVDKFQNDKKTKIFLGQLQAAGVGITLTAAHQVLFVSQSWVPGENFQAADRCNRIGQTKTVTARVMALTSSRVDYSVASLLARKANDLNELNQKTGGKNGKKQKQKSNKRKT